MRRRTFVGVLGAGISVGLTGCLSGSLFGYNDHRITMEPVETDEELAEAVSVWAYEGKDVKEAFEHAIDCGWNIRSEHSPLQETIPYEFEGAFYSAEEDERPWVSDDSEDEDTIESRIDIDCSDSGRNNRHYTFEVVASDATEYAEMLRDEYQHELTGLTEDERRVLEDAIEDKAESSLNSTPDGFRPLWSKIKDGTRLPLDETYPHYLVLYDGTEYVTEMFHESGG